MGKKKVKPAKASGKGKKAKDKGKAKGKGKGKAKAKAAKKKVQAIPKGYQTLTPYIVLANAMQAIEYYKAAFGAKLQVMMPGPNGTVAHAELGIFGSKLMLSDMTMDGSAQPPDKLGGTSAGLMLYVKDTDAVFNKAIAAGGQPVQPPTDMFWGDRYGQLRDPFGHLWSIATHIEDVSPKEMQKRAAAAMAGPPPGPVA